MEIVGTLKVKSDAKQVSEKFKIREFVLTIEPNSKYPQHVSFQLSQDKCGLIDTCGIGDELRVQFNLRGREHNGQNGIKYFNTLEAWKIEKLVGSGNNTPAASATSTSGSKKEETANEIVPPYTDNNDDLPF